MSDDQRRPCPHCGYMQMFRKWSSGDFWYAAEYHDCKNGTAPQQLAREDGRHNEDRLNEDHLNDSIEETCQRQADEIVALRAQVKNMAASPGMVNQATHEYAVRYAEEMKAERDRAVGLLRETMRHMRGDKTGQGYQWNHLADQIGGLLAEIDKGGEGERG